MLRGLFSHGQTEDFGQCGIEGGAGLLTDLLQGFVVAETCPFGSFRGQVVITHPLPPLPWRDCRYEYPDVLSRGGLSSPRLDRAAFHVAQQSFDNQPHEEEAQLRVLVVQAIDFFVGHLVQFAISFAQHRQGAYLLRRK